MHGKAIMSKEQQKFCPDCGKKLMTADEALAIVNDKIRDDQVNAVHQMVEKIVEKITESAKKGKKHLLTYANNIWHDDTAKRKDVRKSIIKRLKQLGYKARPDGTRFYIKW